MGREVRRVPADWQHPKGKDGQFIPLFGGDVREKQAQWDEEAAQWDEEAAQWAAGLRRDWNEPGKWVPHGELHAFEEWDGSRPDEADHMPVWPPEVCTHWQMYETCTEGTPISPVLESPEAVARWCADNGASAFGSMVAGYEFWLNVCRGTAGFGVMMTTQPDGSQTSRPV